MKTLQTRKGSRANRFELFPHRKPARRRAHVLASEALESRQLLAANVLDSASAMLAASGSTRDVQMTVATPGAPAGTMTALMIHVDPATNSLFDPAAVTVRAVNTGAVFSATSSNDDARGLGSMAVVEVPAGVYTIQVRGEGSSTGAFNVHASLAGDLFAASGVVTEFEEIYATAAMTQSMGTGNFVTNTYYLSRGIDVSRNLYDAGLDGNSDGRIDGGDLAQVSMNRRAGTTTVDLLSDAQAPAITARLVNDTGRSSTDSISTDPTISGTVTDESPIATFQGRLDNRAFVDLSGRLSSGAFTLDRTQLNSLAGGTLSEGSHTLELSARDDIGNEVSPPFRFTFVFIDQNAAPTARTIPAQNATEDTAFTFNVSTFFSDADSGDVLSFSGTTLPSWLTLDASTGVLTGTPSNDNVGANSVSIQATDSQNANVAATFSINVANINDAPVVRDIPNQQAAENAPFELNIGSFVSDVDAGDTVTISVFRATGFNPDGSVINQQPLPSWLTFDSATGRLTGTPPSSENGMAFSIGVLAVDRAGLTDNDIFSLTVVGNRRPVLNSPIPTQSAIVGGTLNLNLATFFSDPDGDDLDFTLLLAGPNGTLPSWISFNSETGAVTGTPTAADVGSFTFIASAMDGSLSSEPPTTFTVNVVNQPVVRFALRTFDTNGTQITSITPGGTFELRGFVQDIATTPTGLFSAFMDVTFNQGLAAPATGAIIVHSSTYGAGTSGTISAGLLDEVGGTDGVSPLGGNEFELFRLQFTAGQSAGVVTFTSDPADDTLLHPVLRFQTTANVPNSLITFGTTSITIGGAGAPLSSRFTIPGTNSESPYDVNGDSLITPLDALLVINYLNVTSTASDVFTDVNSDGGTTPIDALLVINQLNLSVARAPLSSGAIADDDDDSSATDALYDAVFAEGGF